MLKRAGVSSAYPDTTQKFSVMYKPRLPRNGELRQDDDNLPTESGPMPYSFLERIAIIMESGSSFYTAVKIAGEDAARKTRELSQVLRDRDWRNRR